MRARRAPPWPPAHGRRNLARGAGRARGHRDASRSKAITAVSAFIPGTANSVVLGSRAALPAENHRVRATCLRCRPPAGRAARPSGQPPPRQPRLTASAAAPKPAMPATFSVPAARAALLAAAVDQRIADAGHRALISAPTPCGPPILCADSVIRSAPSALKSQGIRPGALHRIDMQEAASRVHDRRHLGDRLDHAGLVVGEHDARPAAAQSASRAGSRSAGQIDNASLPSPECSSARGKPPAAPHRRMLDRRHQQRRRRSAGDSASVLASVPPDVNTTSPRLGPDQRRDLLPRVLDEAPRARGRRHGPRTDCRQVQRRRPWRPAPRPQRRGRVPVEIGLRRHHPHLPVREFHPRPDPL